ncbi:MAG: hydratase, partial [Planctomycetota bacterium]|nr:hydratase [Planctomycetota bacterium]
RHATRNFPNREGSRPGEGQLAGVALMDARSIAATAARGGLLAAADEEPVTIRERDCRFDGEVYRNRVYQGFGRPEPEHELRFGPNIADWPALPALPRHLLLKVASFITDPVTTTDELIPSGETSSYRSNPPRLAEFTLQRRDPGYVARAKAAREPELIREKGGNPATGHPELAAALARAAKASGLKLDPAEVGLGSALHAAKPGDGSAREQAASCQKVLGGWANLAREYATKRYRSNLINWGILPLVLEGEPPYGLASYIFIPEARKAVLEDGARLTAYALEEGGTREFSVTLGVLTPDERRILAAGCLINFYREGN